MADACLRSLGSSLLLSRCCELAYHDLGEPQNAETTLQRTKTALDQFKEWAVDNGDWGNSAEVLSREAETKISGSDEPKPSERKVTSSDEPAESLKQESSRIEGRHPP